MDSGSFAQALTECAQQESLSDGESFDQMGGCCSRPDANGYSPEPSDSSVSSLSYDSNPSSLSSESNPSSPARPIRALFDYRTAELPEANVNGICLGLAAEWLLDLNSSPSSRMSALQPGAQNHASAAARQKEYEDAKTDLRNAGAEGSHDLQARSKMLGDAGLHPSNEQTRYRFGSSSRIDKIVKEITADPSVYVLSLRFAAGGRHSIATSTSNGMTTLFDPNYGEFTVRSDQIGEVFKSLAERYRNPNQRDISTVVTQRVA
ncbi:YopT-type cysteine protease domain-containing protein [Bradyrhizobium elkanii]|uniref:YopT-type cysteine protease domain-containing protein n=1 Tax=Bradyrhizobium elkanii TaxID=29448 RepID=UPI002012B24E|nr:YopT-type cysteine protease domain-containing protein [Bradyrhizobium elkanii]